METFFLVIGAGLIVVAAGILIKLERLSKKIEPFTGELNELGNVVARILEFNIKKAKLEINKKIEESHKAIEGNVGKETNKQLSIMLGLDNFKESVKPVPTVREIELRKEYEIYEEMEKLSKEKINSKSISERAMAWKRIQDLQKKIDG